ncbi:ribosomal RNA small subunit methyltransferase G [Tanacetum coccineum]
MNLTAVTEASEVMDRHIEDSLAIIPPIRSSYSSYCESDFENLNLVDVGSGAGLPGLILAIACPGWKVTLLESLNKRCVFLEHAIGLIGLSNVKVVRGRAEKMNLTAVTEASEVMDRHIEDSLAIIPPIRSSYSSYCESDFENLNLVDVGSGAGLPGLILAIACPGWKVTLLESLNKRCVFLEHAIGLIGLSNVKVVRGRAEVFDVTVARAVAEMRVLAEYCLPLVRVGGLFVAAKGHAPEEEVTRAKRAISLMGASLLETCYGSYQLLSMSPKFHGLLVVYQSSVLSSYIGMSVVVKCLRRILDGRTSLRGQEL